MPTAPATTPPTTVAVLLVAYPVFDLAAAVDHRASGGIDARGPLQANMALSGLAAAGLAVAASGAPAALPTRAPGTSPREPSSSSSRCAAATWTDSGR